jgi:hypothetical protein
MFTALLIVTIMTIVANAAMFAAGLARARFVVANADQVHAPRSWVPFLAILKGAGAAGLLLGLIGIHAVGIAAAAGLVAFFVVAIGFHVRARVFYNLAFPGAYLAMAIGSLAFAIIW